jgi:N-acetylglucosaminyldiphosphoundecaprenol N-acetyl-beta-D-mannosaminyltransferase
VIKKINDSGANILLVAFGQVKQEIWIKDNLPLMPSVKVGIGIGGTFDYLTGKIKRPPAWLRRVGLEWSYRLIIMPSRAGRIYNATVKFTWLVLKEKLKK